MDADGDMFDIYKVNRYSSSKLLLELHKLLMSWFLFSKTKSLSRTPNSEFSSVLNSFKKFPLEMRKRLLLILLLKDFLDFYVLVKKCVIPKFDCIFVLQLLLLEEMKSNKLLLLLSLLLLLLLLYIFGITSLPSEKNALTSESYPLSEMSRPS